MKPVRELLVVLMLAGCQGGHEADTTEGVAETAPPAEAPVMAPSEVNEVPAMAGPSVADKLTEMGAVVVPTADSGIKGVMLEELTVSSETIDLIVAVPDLEILSLSGTLAGDAELKRIGQLTNLKVLLLGGTKVTDEGLVHLEALTSLERLGLGGTQVTDAGLKHLESLTTLKKLFLAETQVTEEGVAAFQQAVPACEIER